ncbi:mercury methylation ferredoxin HgcB [Geopsychrobacter electrodiphilus]|uniref:mercury methylation ferredoxin HgcB n=1 Tax=Geopsychrobacter electrodiphilus TaxID=225196 RepID=UPI00035F6533|nr:mercury methylation ferredoxin HgcB [Geopsychrobacter electrodiphilus]
MAHQKYLKNVVTLKLEQEKCVGCGLCAIVCPRAVFKIEDDLAWITALDNCMECGACVGNCPVGAITVHAGVGCASAIIHSWLTGDEPSCDCGGGGNC